MKDRNQWLAITTVVMMLGVVWIAVSTVPAAEISSGVIASPRKGFQAPDFSLDALDGSEITLSALRGQVVVVNLWASWCPPCRAEMPALQMAHEDLADQGLVVLGVNMAYQDSQREAVSFATEMGLTFPIVFDHTGEISRLYRMYALPTTFFVDPEGIIREVIVGGSLNEAAIRSIVTDLFEESF